MMTFPTEWKVIIHSMVPVTTNQFFMFPGFCTWRWHQTVGLRGSSHHTQLDPSKTSKNTESSTPGAPESLQFSEALPQMASEISSPLGVFDVFGGWLQPRGLQMDGVSRGRSRASPPLFGPKIWTNQVPTSHDAQSFLDSGRVSW